LKENAKAQKNQGSRDETIHIRINETTDKDGVASRLSTKLKFFAFLGVLRAFAVNLSPN